MVQLFIDGGNNPPNTWLNRISTRHFDVTLSLPQDSTVRVQSGNEIVVPLTIRPKEGNKIAGFEFEIKFNEKELKFIDMKTDVYWTLVHIC